MVGDDMNPPFNLAYFMSFLIVLLFVAPVLLTIGFVVIAIMKRRAFRLIYSNSFAAALFITGALIYYYMRYELEWTAFYFESQESFLVNCGKELGILYMLFSIFIVLFGIVLMLFPPKSPKRERPPKPTLKP